MHRPPKANVPPAPEPALPQLKIDWSDKERESLAKLLNSEPAKPTEALIRAVRVDLVKD